MFSEELKALRSNFLVHWTGAKDIEKEPNLDPEAKSRKYLCRLKGTLKEGLWMKNQPIKLYNESLGYKKSFCWPATCFTEIKLSQTKNHTERYGSLGFGFTRQFVMDRYGAPVLYVPSDKECDRNSDRHRNLDTISPHLLKLYDVLDILVSKTAGEVDAFHEDPKPIIRRFMDSIDFEQSLRDFGYRRESQELCRIFEFLRASVATVAIFIKEMSDEDCKYKFELLEEAEWRIPYTKTATDPEKVKPPIKDINDQKSGKNPVAKIQFNPDDLKVLIFPDKETREMASDDDYFQCWLKKRGGFPIMATVKECGQF